MYLEQISIIIGILVLLRERSPNLLSMKGEHYDWHRDCDVTTDLQRKISVTVQLSDPSSYEGGELHIKDYWNENEILVGILAGKYRVQ